MTVDDFKNGLIKAADDLIDVYFGTSTFMDKMSNATLKLIAKASIDKIDAITPMFTKPDGTLDVDTIVDTYAEQIGDGVVVDIRDFVSNEYLKQILPNKTLKISASDIRKIKQS